MPERPITAPGPLLVSPDNPRYFCAGGRAVYLTGSHLLVDTLPDLPNVLYVVANESSGLAVEDVPMPGGESIPTRIGDSTAWHYRVIEFVREYAHSRGFACPPIGMPMAYPGAEQSRVNEVLALVTPFAENGPVGFSLKKR
jgi:hypothetical protein